MSETKTAEGLVAFVKSKIGTAYVYGMKGDVLTKSKYKDLKKRYGSYVWDTDRSKIGKTCVDCSGLISWYTGIIRNSNGYNITSTRVTSIKNIADAVPGCAVWKRGHIGVYIGNGYIVEAKGSKYGVVISEVSKSDFTNILWLKDIDYSKTTTKTKYYAKCTYTGCSIVDGLKSIGVNSSFESRRNIAHINGITDYNGTASENTQLLNLLKAGKLKKEV